MCLIALAYKVHPQYPLVLVANRDEYYDRATEQVGWWSDNPGLLAGRDLQAGGTWLGINRNGYWAAVTNYREGEPGVGERSRGDLVASYLKGSETPSGFARNLESVGSSFGGFSLLLGSPDQLVYCSNRSSGIQSVTPGFHALSNNLLDVPWPKARLARQNLKNRLRCTASVSARQLLPVLAHRGCFADQFLPSTGVDTDWERTLSAPFIVSEGYGTRCTSVLLVDRFGEVSFLEQTFSGGRANDKPREFRFSIGDGWPDRIGGAV